MAAKRASEDITAALASAREQRKQILPLPTGHELKPIGFDLEKGQLTEARRFVVEEVARIYGLPPVFLQDLTRRAAGPGAGQAHPPPVDRRDRDNLPVVNDCHGPTRVNIR
jgi:hypothetical protein